MTVKEFSVFAGDPLNPGFGFRVECTADGEPYWKATISAEDAGVLRQMVLTFTCAASQRFNPMEGSR